MRRTSLSLWILALAILASACSSDTSTEPKPEPEPPGIRDWRVVAVSGDQSRTASSSSAAASPLSQIQGAPIGSDGYSSEPLVARIELTPEAEQRGVTLAGLPTGTLVHWHISGGGGRLYGQATVPDDTAHIVNRWAPSTRAGDYTITAGRLVDGEIVTDATWTVTVEPGPAAQIDVPPHVLVWLGDTLDLRDLATATDDYGNLLGVEWEGVDSTLTYTPMAEGYDTLIVSSGTLSRELEVVSIQPISEGWTYTVHCVDGNIPWAPRGPVDSVFSYLKVDSVRTSWPSGSWPGSPEVEVTTYGSSQYNIYWKDHFPSEVSHPAREDLYRLRPGAIGVHYTDIEFIADGTGAYIADPGICGDATMVQAGWYPPEH